MTTDPKKRDTVKKYTSDDIDVTWDSMRCIHAAECTRGLHSVFNVEQKPWIQPREADADEVAEVVMRCPTGALQFVRKDGGEAEPVPEGPIEIALEADGPLYLRGNITVLDADENVILEDTRLALCRCGQSESKPFCDGTHSDLEDWTAPASLDTERESQEHEGSDSLNIQTAENGPLLLSGDFVIRTQYGHDEYQGKSTALCRCGQSGHKPFCDGTHSDVGFEG